MELQRVTIAIVTLFLCYCMVILNLQGKGSPSRHGDLSAILEYTYFDNSLNKQGQEFWNSIQPRFQCPPEHLARTGNPGDGGKWTCGLSHFGKFSERSRDKACYVYSFGVSGDSTFEAEMLSNTLCTVYAYDPTVNQIARPLNTSNPRVHFFKLGISGQDKENYKTLRTLMQENGGHVWIDILKVDVEGAEYASLSKIMDDFEELPFGQLLVELHVTGKWDARMKEMILGLFKNLEEKGLRMFYKEINVRHPTICSEFSFINTKALERFLDTEYLEKLSSS